jgi:hypothetical protein
MAERALKAPDSHYLMAVRTELGDLYREQDQEIDNFRAQREMRVPALADAPNDYLLVHVDPRDPAITEEAFQQTAILTLDRPTIHIDGGESDTQQTLATDREHWTAEVLWRCGTREPGSDTMTQVTDACLNDGGGWSKLLWAADLWAERYALKTPGEDDSGAAYTDYDKATEEAKKRAGPPFAWCYVDPRTVYPSWAGGALCEVLEVNVRPLRSTFRKYRLGRDAQGNIVPEELAQPVDEIQGGRISISTVDFLELWDDTWVTYAVGGMNYHGQATGHIVKQFKHKYPFGVPYDYAPGLSMSHWRNRKVGWSLGRTKLWLIQYRQYLRAMHAQYVARDLLSPLVTYGDTTAAPVIGNDGLPREVEPGPHPGEIINLPAGRQLNRIPYPDATTLEKHMGLVDQAIMQLESPKVTTLSGMEGAGFAISQILSYTRTRVGPVRHGLERLLLGQTEKLWTLVRTRAQEKVWVFYSGDDQTAAGYLGLGPADFEKPMQVKWEVQAELPTDQMINARYWHERLAAGTAGFDEAIEGLGGNPDEIRRSKMRDKIRESPQYQQWLMQQVFMNAGRGDILAKASQAEQLAMQGQVGGAGSGAGGMNTPAPGVFEGGAPGAGGVPDLGALAAAPNGAGVSPPPYEQVVQGAAQPGPA